MMHHSKPLLAYYLLINPVQINSDVIISTIHWGGVLLCEEMVGVGGVLVELYSIVWTFGWLVVFWWGFEMVF